MNFRMTSYADNFEDVMIQRAFPMDAQGFYIDVGAYNPVEHSVTKHFYDRGWRGINVEPNPKPFALLQSLRERDVNLNIGLSNRDGDLTIYEAPNACWSVDRAMLTGYFGASEADIVTHSIPIRTLAEIIDEHVPPGTTTDFLKVDVEGHEREVLEGGDWTRHRPRIILAESNGYETWQDLLLNSGYHFTLFDGVNRFYVRDEDKHLIPSMSTPANASDSFLIYGYMRRINALEQQVHDLNDALYHTNRQLGEMHDRYDQYNATSLKVAGQISRASRQYPSAVRLAKRIVPRLSRRCLKRVRNPDTSL